jgi:iron complex transport system permease protein
VKSARAGTRELGRGGARRSAVFAALGAGLAAALVAGVTVGAVRVPVAEVLRMAARALGLHGVAQPDATHVTIIAALRLPRVLAAAMVGGSLAVAGVVMQGLFRNPMASPEILGISAGGSLGAVAAITTGLASASALALPAATAAGALLAAALIYGIAGIRGGTSLLFIVIAGMAISSLFNGLVSGMLLFSKQYEVSAYLFWTMGDFEGRTWQHLALAAPVLLPGVAALSLFSRELNLFTLGEEGARSLGMNVEAVKRLLLVLSALVTGAAISVSGPVGFVGLLVPHLLRLLVGPDHRVLVPASALGGALFLLCCDLVGRTVAPPMQIRVGIITAVVGSPYLLWLVVRSQRRGGA